MVVSDIRQSWRPCGHSLQERRDAALVLDSIKGYESGDMFTALAKGLIPKEPYASFVVKDAAVEAPEGCPRRDCARVHGEAHQERRSYQRPDR